MLGRPLPSTRYRGRVRRNGSVTSASGLVPFAHLGWGYRGRDEFDARAAEFLADGLAQQQWVELVGDGSRDELEQRLCALPGGAEALEAGRAGVLPIDDAHVYDNSGVVDPKASVERRVAAIDEATGRGFSGVRGIFDATALVPTPEHREAFTELEHLLDQKMAVLPVSALCAYDLDQLGSHADELVCLHPFTDASNGQFRIFATGEGRLALCGELDLANRELFALVCTRLLPRLEGEVVIDIGGVPYVEHNALVLLDELAARRDAPVVLRNADTLVRHVTDLLRLDHLQVAPPT